MGYPAGWPDFANAKPMVCTTCGGVTLLDRPDPVKEKSWGHCQHCGKRRIMKQGVFKESMLNVPPREVT